MQTDEQNPVLIVLKRGGVSDDREASIPPIPPTDDGAPGLAAAASLAAVAGTEGDIEGFACHVASYGWGIYAIPHAWRNIFCVALFASPKQFSANQVQ